MSDLKMMSVTEARAWLDPSTGPKPEVPSPLLVDRYARTIVHQAEQIERLQNALQEVEEWGMSVLEALDYVGIIRPGDMEPPA